MQTRSACCPLCGMAKPLCVLAKCLQRLCNLVQHVQICDNYAIATAKSGDTLAAARAFVRTVELSQGGHVNLAILAEIVAAVEEAHGCSRGGAACAHDARYGAILGAGAHEAEAPACTNGADEDAGDAVSQEVVDGGEDAARVLEALAAVTVGTSADTNKSGAEDADGADAADAAAAEGLLRRRAMLVRHSVRCACIDVVASVA